MASLRPARALRLVPGSTVCSRCARSASSGLRWSSTEAAAPSTLLARIKNDLKVAMRAKDTARLTVVRGTISEINQAASTSTPVTKDLQILALLRKRKASTETAIQEARAANRPDLVEKQEKEVAVIDELVGSLQLMNADEMRPIVQATIENLKRASSGALKQSDVMKELLKPGAELADKPLEKKVLSEVVKEELQ